MTWFANVTSFDYYPAYHTAIKNHKSIFLWSGISSDSLSQDGLDSEPAF